MASMHKGRLTPGIIIDRTSHELGSSTNLGIVPRIITKPLVRIVASRLLAGPDRKPYTGLLLALQYVAIHMSE